jgi:uncharacterized protein YpmB
MVAKLTILVVLFVVVVGAILYAGFRYIDRQAQRRHEREMARSEREYDLLMEDAEEDAADAPEEESSEASSDRDSEPE